METSDGPNQDQCVCIVNLSMLVSALYGLVLEFTTHTQSEGCTVYLTPEIASTELTVKRELYKK